MPAEKKAFEAHAGHDVHVTMPDGSDLHLEPGNPYVTSDPWEIEMLEQVHLVKSGPPPGAKAKD